MYDAFLKALSRAEMRALKRKSRIRHHFSARDTDNMFARREGKRFLRTFSLKCFTIRFKVGILRRKVPGCVISASEKYGLSLDMKPLSSSW